MTTFKTLFTLVALLTGLSTYAQQNGVTIVNDSDCDFDYVLVDEVSGGSTNCSMGSSTTTGTVPANSSVFVPHNAIQFVHVELTTSCAAGSIGAALSPKTAAVGCAVCTAQTAPNKVSPLPTPCCGDVEIIWGAVDCTVTETSKIVIKQL